MEQTPRRKIQSNMEGFVVPVRQQQRVVPQIPRPALPEAQKLHQPTPPTAAPDADQSSQTDFPRYFSPQFQTPPPKKKRFSFKNLNWSRRRKIWTGAFTTLALIIGIGAWYGSSILGNLNKIFHGNIFSDAKALFSNTKLKGEDQGRVNILLAGDSVDDPNHGGAQLTDSIMLVSIDTRNHTGFMLSIPRDLWVDIPGWSHQKINAANEVNNFNQPGYPKSGMGQLEQIVQNDLGIPVDYYALIDYTAFKDAVNAVGGISINIQSTDPRGLFDPNISRADSGPLKLPNGWVNLNGQTALNLARARGDPCGCYQVEYGFPNSDYDRTQHQRQMLSALASKAATLGVIADPFKVSNLFNAFGSNVQTDLNVQDLIRLMQITKSMNITHLQSLVYNKAGTNALLTSYLTPDGEEALIPVDGIDNFGKLQQYYQQLTSNNPVVREAPSVVVLNGTNTTGLAAKEAAILKADGFDVTGVSDTNSQYSTSLIVDLTKGQKPASAKFLQSLMAGGQTPITTSTTSTPEASEAAGYNADFIVILGSNTNRVQQP